MAVRRFLLPILVAFMLLASGALAGSGLRGASYTISVATATVGGKSQKILTDANGFALYYLTSDKLTSLACTGKCLRAWPPVITKARPTAPASVRGKLARANTVNGSQVSYKGHLLYRYAADVKPGQVNGNELDGPRGGEWYVATP